MLRVTNTITLPRDSPHTLWYTQANIYIWTHLGSHTVAHVDIMLLICTNTSGGSRGKHTNEHKSYQSMSWDQTCMQAYACTHAAHSQISENHLSSHQRTLRLHVGLPWMELTSSSLFIMFTHIRHNSTTAWAHCKQTAVSRETAHTIWCHKPNFHHATLSNPP